MRNSISKAAVAAVAALSLGAALLASTEPAAAQWRHGGGGWGGGGWHGGYGGWRGGGGSWHGGYWRGGRWYNGWWGPAVAAGVLAGAAIATYPAWGGYGYGGDYGYGGGGGGCWQYRTTYDGYGNPLGQSWVNLC
jgi:hypothetical protein